MYIFLHHKYYAVAVFLQLWACLLWYGGGEGLFQQTVVVVRKDKDRMVFSGFFYRK